MRVSGGYNELLLPGLCFLPFTCAGLHGGPSRPRSFVVDSVVSIFLVISIYGLVVKFEIAAVEEACATGLTLSIQLCASSSKGFTGLAITSAP